MKKADFNNKTSSIHQKVNELHNELKDLRLRYIKEYFNFMPIKGKRYEVTFLDGSKGIGKLWHWSLYSDSGEIVTSIYGLDIEVDDKVKIRELEENTYYECIHIESNEVVGWEDKTGLNSGLICAAKERLKEHKDMFCCKIVRKTIQNKQKLKQ